MSILNEKKLLDKTRELSQLNKTREAIELLLPFIKDKQIKDCPKLFLRYAFLLYHVKLGDYGTKDDSKKKKTARDNLVKATKLLLKILSQDKNIISKKDLLNTKIYLAQIYAILGNKKAIPLSISNYKNSPSAVTTNRLANVYLILGDIRKAKIWYKKYEDLLTKEKKMDFVALGDLAVIYKSLGDMNKANRYFRKVLPLIPRNNAGWCISYILKANGFTIKKNDRGF